MTRAEIERYLEGALWRLRRQAQMDYTLGDLIGVSVARIMSKDVEFPSIEKVYPDLFEAIPEKQAEKQQDDIMLKSQNRFLEFARQHNAKMRREEADNGN